MVKYRAIKNKKGYIVACLYILPNGNLHADSWLCPVGWGSREHKFPDLKEAIDGNLSKV